jgi:hypothetical protein
MMLSIILHVNAAFTGACGLICLLATTFVVTHCGILERFWVVVLGSMLLAYVPTLLLAAWRPTRWLIKTIIVLDWGYVGLAAIFCIIHWSKVSSVGAFMVIGSAFMVAVFAALQQKYTSSA